MQVWSTLTSAELFHQHDRAQEVERFLDSLRSCESTTSSRLLIFNTDSIDLQSKENDVFETDLSRAFSATMDLLLAHVLGIEYDVEFYAVDSRLNQAYTGDRDLLSFHNTEFGDPGYALRDMIFYGPTHLDALAQFDGPEVQLMRAYTLGVREIKNRKVDISRWP